MVISPVLRQVMADRESLRCYSGGFMPSFDEVSRRLLLLERSHNYHLPDHYYKRGREMALSDIKTIPSLLTIGLHRLADSHLELKDAKIFVREDAWPDWQELLTLCSPLICISALLWKKL